MYPAQRRQAVQPSAAGPWTVTLGTGLVVSLALALAQPALAAEPSPLLIDPLDPRAEGEGPGLVGDPLLALTVVLVLGLLAAGAAVLFVRLTQRR